MAIDPSDGAGRIVVGVDGSEPSKNALRWADFISKATGSSIEAISVWRLPASAAGGNGWGGSPNGKLFARDAVDSLKEQLDEVFGPTHPAGLHGGAYEGSAAKVLIDVSRDAHMLVLGSRGHGGFAGMLLGSVSAACAAHAACPVLVVHGDNPPPTTTS